MIILGDFEKAVQKLRRDFQARQTPLIEQRDQAPWDQLEILQILGKMLGYEVVMGICSWRSFNGHIKKRYEVLSV